MRNVLMVAVVAFALASAVSAQSSFTLKTIDAPGATFTRLHNINRRGDIVGLFRSGTSLGHGFLLHGHTFQQIDFPGAIFTSARGINSSREITGGYVDTNDIDHGFLLKDGQFTSFDYPGA